MSKHYKHLSKEERDRLAILKGEDLSIRTIATQLGRSPSTVSRELRRNADSNISEGYLPHKAQTLADVRWKKKTIVDRASTLRSCSGMYDQTSVKAGRQNKLLDAFVARVILSLLVTKPFINGFISRPES